MPTDELKDGVSEPVEPEIKEQVFYLALVAGDNAATIQKVSQLLAAAHVQIRHLDRNDHARTGAFRIGFASARDRDKAAKVFKLAGMEATAATGQETS